MEIYSREWLNLQFKISWEVNNGPAQTRYFMEAMLTNLPQKIRDFIAKETFAMLDWGCAMGDGVEVLSQAFPQSRVAGIDISDEAITQAKQRYPNREFIREDAILQPYDIIWTSNCLEHFHEPLALMAQHFAMARLLYILLVPYNEEPLIEGHFKRFTLDTFPEVLAGFKRVTARPFQTSPQYWAGNQIFVIYGSPAFLNMFEKPSLWQALVGKRR